MNELVEINNKYAEAYSKLGSAILECADEKDEIFKIYVDALNIYKAMAVHVCCEANAEENEAMWGITVDNRVLKRNSEPDMKTFVYLE